ncbi:MAG: hypothetical protein GQ574_13910 [Crocinitomix sp.]|nr:hypothetical protein [Crocinitomix sp.]
MKRFVFIFICAIPLFTFSQNENLTGKYCYDINFDHTPISRKYTLRINSDSTFLLLFYVNEVCYDYTDTMNGKWRVQNEDLNLHFIDVNENQTKLYGDSNWIFKVLPNGDLISLRSERYLGKKSKKHFIKNCT